MHQDCNALKQANGASHTMAQQQDLFSQDPPAPDREPHTVSRSRRATRPNLWLQRIELLVRVIVRLYLGLLIMALPWMRFWTENGLFSYVPGTSLLANSGFLRGVVSGLGMLNVAMAFQELFSPDHKL
jgi:hypothetical protein